MEHAVVSPRTLLWPVLNFIIFVAVLVRFLRGPIVEYFRVRTAKLRDGLRAGARARQEAANLRDALARDVENLPALRMQILTDMRAAAEVERNRLLELARTASDRIRKDARLLAEQDVAAARRRLQSEVIDEAVREATALVRRAFRPEDQERIVRDFVVGAGAEA